MYRRIFYTLYGVFGNLRYSLDRLKTIFKKCNERQKFVDRFGDEVCLKCINCSKIFVHIFSFFSETLFCYVFLLRSLIDLSFVDYIFDFVLYWKYFDHLLYLLT